MSQLFRRAKPLQALARRVEVRAELQRLAEVRDGTLLVADPRLARPRLFQE